MEGIPALEGLNQLNRANFNLSPDIDGRPASKLLTRCTSLEYQIESTRASETATNKGFFSQASFKNLTNPTQVDPVFPTAPFFESGESLQGTLERRNSEIRIKTYSRPTSVAEIEARVSHLSIRDSTTAFQKNKQLKNLFGSAYQKESMDGLTNKSIKVLRSLEPKVTRPSSTQKLESPLIARKVSKAVGLMNLMHQSVDSSNFQSSVGRLDKPGIQILLTRRSSHREIPSKRPSTNMFRLNIPEQIKQPAVEVVCLLPDKRVESPTKLLRSSRKGMCVPTVTHMARCPTGDSKATTETAQQPKVKRCELLLQPTLPKTLMQGFSYKNIGNRTLESPTKLGKGLRTQLLHSLLTIERRSLGVGIPPHVSISPT